MARPDPRAAKERKQKIFVVVGGLLLVGLLAIQLPRILGGSPEEVSASSEPTAPATDPGSASPAPPAVAAPTARPVATTLDLGSLSVFSSKDPFVQQVKSPSATATSSGGSGKASGGDTGGAKDTATEESTKSFTLGGSPSASVTVISVNGARQAVVTGAAFPSIDPVFVLVAEHPEQKSVTIGVAGGAFASGATKSKLAVGKPLVLVNTATGARYRLKLVAVGNGSAAKPADGPDTPTAQP